MFNINYIELFKILPPQAATMLIAMLPIAELRVSIPIALSVYKLSIFSSLFWSVLGNIIPAIIIIRYINPISVWLRKKSRMMEKFFNWWFAKTKGKFQKSYLKYGGLALVIFVAIPLPMTGAWTGALAAFLFGIPTRRAIWLVLAGVVIAGIIVSITTKFGMMGFKMANLALITL